MTLQGRRESANVGVEHYRIVVPDRVTSVADFALGEEPCESISLGLRRAWPNPTRPDLTRPEPSFAPLVGGFWFPLLNRVTVGNKATTALARASMDQFVAAPIVLGGFFAFAGMLEGKSVEDVKTKVESVSSRGWHARAGTGD